MLETRLGKFDCEHKAIFAVSSIFQLDLGRRHEPYRVSWVRRLGGRVRVDDPSTVALVVAEGYNILSV